MLTTIPFSGFYNTIHDAEIDRELESMVSNSSGNGPISSRISNDIWSTIHSPVSEYSRAYLEGFNAMLNSVTGLDVKLEFESVQSPREYNFATDRIFANVSYEDVDKMYKKMNPEIFDIVLKQRFTSRSGFISYYSSNFHEWGELSRWDYNQVGTILEVLITQFFGSDWENDIISDWSGNGMVSDWVYNNLTDEGKRLVKIADYLRSREERKYR